MLRNLPCLEWTHLDVWHPLSSCCQTSGCRPNFGHTEVQARDCASYQDKAGWGWESRTSLPWNWGSKLSPRLLFGHNWACEPEHFSAISPLRASSSSRVSPPVAKRPWKPSNPSSSASPYCFAASGWTMICISTAPVNPWPTTKQGPLPNLPSTRRKWSLAAVASLSKAKE